MTNQSVLITGGSRGLGKALALELAGAGAKVVLVARGREELTQAVAEVRAVGEAHGITADVGDKDAIYRITGEAARLVGPIDVLIHDASTLGPTPLRLLSDTDCEDLERVLQVNLVGPFRLTKVIAGSMVVRGGGTIVSISSDAAVEAYPGWGAYSVSKAALDHLSRIWAKELAASGVRFFAVDPGEMDTQMHKDALPEADPASLARPAAIAKKIADMIGRAPNGERLSAAKWPLPDVLSSAAHITSCNLEVRA